MSTYEQRLSSLWAIGIVRTGREEYVKGLLEQHGCEVFYPTYYRWTRPWKRKTAIEVEKPCIPGYLFIRYETIPDNREALVWLTDFRMFLHRPNGDMALLDSVDMEWLEKMGGQKAARKPLRRFWRGQRVHIPEGPWGGLYGAVEAVEKHIVHILIDGWTVPIRCEPGLLRAAG